MSHSEKCPVCEGTGTITVHDLHHDEKKGCAGCDGKGWVTVTDHANESTGKNSNLLLETQPGC